MLDPKLQIILAAKDITGAALTKFQGRITAITKSVFSFRGALGALTGAGGFGVLISRSLETADAIGKTADKLGITTDALQEYRYAAERSGVETRTLDMAMQRFTRRVAEAAQGKGELRGVLEQYNVAVRDAYGNTRRTEAVFRDLANVIQRTTDPAERLRIAFKAFDSEGAALVNMLRDGAMGLDRFAARARELGVVLDNDLIRGSEKAKDAMDDLGLVIQQNFSRVVLENVESITAAVEKLAGALGTVAKYAGLRSRGGTFGMGAAMFGRGIFTEEQWEKFKTADAFERQRMVDAALEGVTFDASGKTIVRKKITGQPGAMPGVMPLPNIPPPPNTPMARAARTYDQTWGPGEMARFAQHDALVRDSEGAYQEMSRHVEDYRDYSIETYEMLDQRLSTSFSHMSDAVADFAQEGKLNFKSFADSLINQLIRIQAYSAFESLFGLAKGFLAGGTAGPVHLGAGGTTAFGMASGGYLGEGVMGIGKRSGQSYEFHPNEYVLPAGKLGGSQVVINNYSGVSATARESTDVNGIKRVFVEIGNDIIRNGPVGQAIGLRYGLRPAGKVV